MATKSKTTTNSVPKESKIICQNKDCDAMGRYQQASNFYKSRNVCIGNYPYCKDCVNKMVDIDDMNTVYGVLQVLDTPFVRSRYTTLQYSFKYSNFPSQSEPTVKISTP